MQLFVYKSVPLLTTNSPLLLRAEYLLVVKEGSQEGQDLLVYQWEGRVDLLLQLVLVTASLLLVDSD